MLRHERGDGETFCRERQQLFVFDVEYGNVGDDIVMKGLPLLIALGFERINGADWFTGI